ncbi:MAG TPA: hypothetical protein VGD79_07320 [Thermoanaerobaculia bacterium]|jgi:hypothetical protein
MAVGKKGGAATFAAAVAEALALIRVGDHTAARKILEPLRAGIPTIYENTLTPSQEDVLRLRVATLLAEIGDHYGDDELSAGVLLPLRRIIDELWEVNVKSLTQFSGDDVAARFFRQKLYYAWQLSVLEYRRTKIEESAQLLQMTLQLAKRLQPRPESLLAHLYFGSGKLALRDLAYNKATLMFRQSILSASSALALARQYKGDAVAIDERAAQYSIAKAIALGMGHCLREKGRVEEAHTVVVAGQLLLGLGSDRELANRAAVLLASVERGAAGEQDRDYLEMALKHLDECSAFKERPADAGYQWRYEHALVQMQRKNLNKAEEEIRALITDVENKNQRWYADALGALSRILRRRRQHGDAVAAARKAVEVSANNHVYDVERRTRTMLIAALYDHAAVDVDRRDQLLEEAQTEIVKGLKLLREDDSRHRASLLLQQARVLNARGDGDVAKRAFAEYLAIRSSIDVGRIKEFEQTVRNELEGERHVCPADTEQADFNLEANRASLERYLLQKVVSLGGLAKNQYTALGISKAQYYKLLEKLDVAKP